MKEEKDAVRETVPSKLCIKKKTEMEHLVVNNTNFPPPRPTTKHFGG
jgi:hypothetical protein